MVITNIWNKDTHQKQSALPDRIMLCYVICI